MAERTQANPLVFVVGAARSGTTLLQRMLDAHPLLAVVNETHWVPRKYREQTGLTRDGMVTDALLPLLLAHRNFPKMGIDEKGLRSLLRGQPQVRYREFVTRIFDAYAAAAGKQLAGDKTPGYVRRIGQLHRRWPGARFVHIIRDPRDVCLSFLDWDIAEQVLESYGTWAMDPVVTVALYWRRSVAMGREQGAMLGPGHYCEVRYEDLTAHTERELRRICAFLGLRYSEAMVRFHEGKTRRDPALCSKDQWLPPTAGLRDWRTQLARPDAERIEIVLGDLLDQLGYERQPPRSGPSVRDRVDRVFEAFTAGMLARSRNLPEAWGTC
jgi:sulfotransferase family protein